MNPDKHPKKPAKAGKQQGYETRIHEDMLDSFDEELNRYGASIAIIFTRQ